MRTLKVVIAEDNTVNADMYIERYRTFFADNNYDAEFTVSACKMDNIARLIASDAFHLLITDITFGDDDEMGGFAVIADIKTKYPNIFVVGNSSADPGVTRTVGPSYDMFIPKDALISNEINTDEWYSREFRKKFRCNTELELEEGALSMFPAKGRTRGEIRRLIQECLFTSHDFDETFDLCKIRLDPLTRGFSDSAVFRVLSMSRVGGFKHIQSVIKISKVDKARKELKNFNRFVKWTLPFEWRVDLLGHALGERFGAVCYSFVDSEDQLGKFYDLETFIENSNDEKVRYVLSKIMDTNARKWYRGDIYKPEPSISEFYHKRYYQPYGSDYRKTQRVFEREVRDILDFIPTAGRVESKVLGESFALPTRGVFGHSDGSCQTCIGHGDLHGRNILVSERDNGKVVFIDFQQTGQCHVFEDFVVLESSLRLNFPNLSDVDLDLIEQEHKLNSLEDPGDDRKYMLMNEIRNRAFDHFPDEPRGNYVFAQLAFSLRLLREKKIVGQARRNILIGIIGACRFFEAAGNGAAKAE